MAPSSDKPTIVCDGAGKVVGVNDAWSALCGYTESEALGKRPADLLQCETTEFDVAAEFTKTLLATGRSGMAKWRKNLFGVLLRNAPTATDYFGLPPNRVVELGAQVEI